MRAKTTSEIRRSSSVQLAPFQVMSRPAKTERLMEKERKLEPTNWWEKVRSHVCDRGRWQSCELPSDAWPPPKISAMGSKQKDYCFYFSTKIYAKSRQKNSYFVFHRENFISDEIYNIYIICLNLKIFINSEKNYKFIRHTSRGFMTAISGISENK
jgi:hypothetical protein